MSVTQGCKNPTDFGIPAEAVDVTRSLFVQRLDVLNEVLRDENARRVFTKDEMCGLAFEALMLGKMIARMDRTVRQEASYA